MYFLFYSLNEIIDEYCRNAENLFSAMFLPISVHVSTLYES